MKILFKYLKPYKWLVALVLFLAAVNIGFSLIDPIIFGKLVNLATYHQSVKELGNNDFFFSNITIPGNHGKPVVLYGVVWLLIASISVAMISRIAKAFQDYFLNLITQKFGATIFTEGLQHAMKLPYQEFEDARSGETLSILQKVRIDTEKFVTSFINVLFP
ncbi:MAG TPA: ABC transporter ATP-binding protein, partial [Chitinophagaceae bacterium]|nr:ABC transporter ATP-binding protein [Chitinophagaceae bacterium]